MAADVISNTNNELKPLEDTTTTTKLIDAEDKSSSSGDRKEFVLKEESSSSSLHSTPKSISSSIANNLNSKQELGNKLRDVEPFIIQQGYLSILGKKHRKWKKRFFALLLIAGEHPLLNCYSSNSRNAAVKCSLNIAYCPAFKTATTKFEIDGHGRTYFFSSSSEKEIDVWVASLKKVASYLNEKNGTSAVGVADFIKPETDVPLLIEPGQVEGYLSKRGDYKSWKNRYFSLRPDRLVYYRDRMKCEPRGWIELCTMVCLVKPETPYKNSSYIIDLRTKDKEYIVLTSSKEDMERWVDSIATNVKQTMLSHVEDGDLDFMHVLGEDAFNFDDEDELCASASSEFDMEFESAEAVRANLMKMGEVSRTPSILEQEEEEKEPEPEPPAPVVLDFQSVDDLDSAMDAFMIDDDGSKNKSTTALDDLMGELDEMDFSL